MENQEFRRLAKPSFQPARDGLTPVSADSMLSNVLCQCCVGSSRCRILFRRTFPCSLEDRCTMAKTSFPPDRSSSKCRSTDVCRKCGPRLSPERIQCEPVGIQMSAGTRRRPQGSAWGFLNLVPPLVVAIHVTNILNSFAMHFLFLAFFFRQEQPALQGLFKPRPFARPSHTHRTLSDQVQVCERGWSPNWQKVVRGSLLFCCWRSLGPHIQAASLNGAAVSIPFVFLIQSSANSRMASTTSGHHMEHTSSQ